MSKKNDNKEPYVYEGGLSETQSEITPLEKDLNTFYEKFYRKGKSVESYPDRLVYRVPLDLLGEFKNECDFIINNNSLNLKSEIVSENGIFLNQCVISENPTTSN